MLTTNRYLLRHFVPPTSTAQVMPLFESLGAVVVDQLVPIPKAWCR